MGGGCNAVLYLIFKILQEFTWKYYLSFFVDCSVIVRPSPAQLQLLLSSNSNLGMLQTRFPAQIGHRGSQDKMSDLRYEIIMMFYGAKFNCKHTINFPKTRASKQLTFQNSIWPCSLIKDLETCGNRNADCVIVFKRIRFRVSTVIRYVCVFICVHFQQRFQIDACSVNTLSVFKRISVDGRLKCIEMYAFSNESALV